MTFKSIDFIVLKQNTPEDLVYLQIILDEIKSGDIEKNILFVDFSMDDLLFKFFNRDKTIQETLLLEQEAPALNMERCKRCGACVMACPEKAITLNRQSGSIIIIPEKCTSCKKCAFACSKNAIQFKKYHTAWIDVAELSANIFLAQCFYKNLEKQFRKIISSTMKAVQLKPATTELVVVLYENQFFNEISKKISGSRINVRTI